jgi:hypothetical protein
MNLLILFFVADLFEEECDVMKEWVCFGRRRRRSKWQLHTACPQE